MVSLRLKRIELQQLILWGKSYRKKCRELMVPFQADEKELLKKLHEIRERTK